MRIRMSSGTLGPDHSVSYRSYSAWLRMSMDGVGKARQGRALIRPNRVMLVLGM